MELLNHVNKKTGVPINMTLLFSREHYVVAAEAYLRGDERRIAIWLNPQVESVAYLRSQNSHQGRGPRVRRRRNWTRGPLEQNG
jgi:hypothetical protein